MKELVTLFLKLGSTAFGGPAAHIAMMEEEIVRKRNWISHEHFLDLLGATNLIPGPNSTEMAIHIGYVRAGWKGLLAAGAAFILPSLIITLLIAHLYVTYGSVPQLGSFITGVRAAIIAVIAGAVFRLGKPVLKKPAMAILGGLVLILNLLGLDEILLLFLAALGGLAWSYRGHARQKGFLGAPGFFLLAAPASAHLAVNSASLAGLGLFFLKIGSILYGSGYVLVAYLQAGLVDARHWLTHEQLLDAIAVGQFTPGPVSSSATFIGYLILGVPGAAVATAGIFFPSFVFVLISSPFIPKLRKSALLSGFLDGASAASLGLMLSVTIVLAGSSLTSAGSWAICLAAVVAIILWNLNIAWIVAGAALLGWLLSTVRWL